MGGYEYAQGPLNAAQWTLLLRAAGLKDSALAPAEAYFPLAKGPHGTNFASAHPPTPSNFDDNRSNIDPFPNTHPAFDSDPGNRTNTGAKNHKKDGMGVGGVAKAFVDQRIHLEDVGGYLSVAECVCLFACVCMFESKDGLYSRTSL
jgi:hypothetical protein